MPQKKKKPFVPFAKGAAPADPKKATNPFAKGAQPEPKAGKAALKTASPIPAEGSTGGPIPGMGDAKKVTPISTVVEKRKKKRR